MERGTSGSTKGYKCRDSKQLQHEKCDGVPLAQPKFPSVIKLAGPWIAVPSCRVRTLPQRADKFSFPPIDGFLGRKQ